jgi:FkbM family methyltransferase
MEPCTASSHKSVYTRFCAALRTELNGSTKAVAHRTALSDRDGLVNLFVRVSTNTGASGMFRHWKVGTATEVVPCTTLDAFFDKNRLNRVRLMKVDCEGAEHLVIAGGRSVLKRGCIDFIAMEYHPSICGEARCEVTHSALTDAGYCLSKPGGQFVYHLPGLEGGLSGLEEEIAGSLPGD